METYCVSCEKSTANKSSNVRRTKPHRLMLVSTCSICSKKNQDSLRIKQSDYRANSGPELH